MKKIKPAPPVITSTPVPVIPPVPAAPLPPEVVKKNLVTNAMSRIMGDDEPEPTPAPVVIPPIVADPPVPPAPVDPSADPEPPDPLADLEEDTVDFDQLPEGVAARQRESLAQKRAAENGRKLKETETALGTMQLELDAARKEAEDLKKKAPRIQSTQDVMNHPEVSRLHTRIMEDLQGVSLTMPVPELGEFLDSREGYGPYMEEFLRMTATPNAAEKRTLNSAFKDKLKNDFLKIYRTSPDYDEAREPQLAGEYQRDIISLLIRRAGDTRELQDKVEKVINQAREGTLTDGAEHYAAQENEIMGVADTLTSLPEEFRTENPHAMESVVLELLEDEAYKPRFNQAKRHVAAMLLGPRALTQTQIDTMKSNGIDVKEFMKKRQDKWQQERETFISMVTQTLLLKPLMPDYIKDALAYRKIGEERKALTKGRDIPLIPPKPQEPTGPRSSAVMEMLAESRKRA